MSIEILVLKWGNEPMHNHNQIFYGIFEFLVVMGAKKSEKVSSGLVFGVRDCSEMNKSSLLFAYHIL